MNFFAEHINVSFVLLMLACFVVSRIPYVGKYVKVVNTLIHETGHTLMALFTDGKVLKVELFSDTSGTTITKSKSKTGQFLIAISGYPFASLMAYFFMLLIFNNFFTAVIIIIGIIAFVNLVFFIRNKEGVIWTLLLLFAIIINFRYGTALSTMISAIIVSGIVFFESLWSAVIVLILSFKKPKDAGDASILSKIAFLPSWFWGFFFLLVALYCSYHVIIMYINFDFKEILETI